MAVRDLLWGCPLCRVPAAIRPAGRRERCAQCGATFVRGRGADIVVDNGAGRVVRAADEWVRELGPVAVPEPGADGVILGPESVRVRIARRQEAQRFGGELLGWVEVYEPAVRGSLTLTRDRLRLAPARGETVSWGPGDLRGLQPASSSVQLRFDHLVVSVKFLEGPVRLWTRAIGNVVREYYRRAGSEVLELQPHLRTCRLTPRT